MLANPPLGGQHGIVLARSRVQPSGLGSLARRAHSQGCSDVYLRCGDDTVPFNKAARSDCADPGSGAACTRRGPRQLVTWRETSLDSLEGPMRLRLANPWWRKGEPRRERVENASP